MKLLYFMASEGYGGAEKVSVEIANGLAERHDVTVLTIRDCPFESHFTPKVRIIPLTSHPTRYNPLQMFEVFRLLRSLRPDLVHTHAAKATELVRAVNRFLGVPHLGTKHNDRKGHVFNSISWVSTVSEKAKESVVAKNQAHIRVIYNGVKEEPVIDRGPAEIFTMLAVGRLDAIKGFDVLIGQVAKLRFPFRLLIVGEGPEWEALHGRIVDLKMEQNITLVGFRDDIAQLMHDAHVVVISSHQEGGPKVMVEALCYARALISTPVGAVPEVLPDEMQAEQAELAGRIAHLHDNYQHCVSLMDKLRESRRRDFLLRDILLQYEEYYNYILDKTSR